LISRSNENLYGGGFSLLVYYEDATSKSSQACAWVLHERSPLRAPPAPPRVLRRTVCQAPGRHRVGGTAAPRSRSGVGVQFVLLPASWGDERYRWNGPPAGAGRQGTTRSLSAADWPWKEREAGGAATNLMRRSEAQHPAADSLETSRSLGEGSCSARRLRSPGCVGGQQWPSSRNGGCTAQRYPATQCPPQRSQHTRTAQQHAYVAIGLVGEGAAGHYLLGLEASGIGLTASIGYRAAATQRSCARSQLVLA
jgi:hypothetical protein